MSHLAGFAAAECADRANNYVSPILQPIRVSRFSCFVSIFGGCASWTSKPLSTYAYEMHMWKALMRMSDNDWRTGQPCRYILFRSVCVCLDRKHDFTSFKIQRVFLQPNMPNVVYFPEQITILEYRVPFILFYILVTCCLRNVSSVFLLCSYFRLTRDNHVDTYFKNK